MVQPEILCAAVACQLGCMPVMNQATGCLDSCFCQYCLYNATKVIGRRKDRPKDERLGEGGKIDKR